MNAGHIVCSTEWSLVRLIEKLSPADPRLLECGAAGNTGAGAPSRTWGSCGRDTSAGAGRGLARGLTIHPRPEQRLV